VDIFPDAAGMVGPESPPLPRGASTFADVAVCSLHGGFHLLPQGTELPDGLAVIADGVDMDRNSPRSPTHHTLYPTVRMPVERFVELVLKLPWQYAGRK